MYPHIWCNDLSKTMILSKPYSSGYEGTIIYCITADLNKSNKFRLFFFNKSDRLSPNSRLIVVDNILSGMLHGWYAIRSPLRKLSQRSCQTCRKRKHDTVLRFRDIFFWFSCIYRSTNHRCVWCLLSNIS